MNIEDGGPAFPVLEYQRSASGDILPTPTIQSGMSLRDWFAGMALQGLCSQNPDQFENPIEIAAVAYVAAEAMLKVRTQKLPQVDS